MGGARLRPRSLVCTARFARVGWHFNKASLAPRLSRSPQGMGQGLLAPARRSTTSSHVPHPARRQRRQRRGRVEE